MNITSLYHNVLATFASIFGNSFVAKRKFLPTGKKIGESPVPVSNLQYVCHCIAAGILTPAGRLNTATTIGNIIAFAAWFMGCITVCDCRSTGLVRIPKKKKAGNKYSGTQAHTNTSTNGHIYIKKGGKWRRNFYRRRFSRHLCLRFQRFPGQEGIVFEPNLLASWR